MTTISLVNLTSGNLAVDVKLDEDRAIRAKLAPGATQLLSGVQLDELDASTEMQALISAGQLELSLTDGPTLTIRASLVDGTTTNADDVTVRSNLPFKMQLLDALLIVSAVEAGETVQLRDTVGGAGAALSTAMSGAATGRISDASTATSEVAAGSLITARRSHDGVEGELILTLQRLS